MTIELLELEKFIKDNPKLREVTAQYRALPHEEQGSVKTKRFPYVTPSGIFTRRSNNFLLQYSGLICIDLDKLVNVEEIRSWILS